MSAARPVVRPATRQDIEAYSSIPNKPSMKAWVAELDGKIIGIGGFALCDGRWLAFCDLKDEMRAYPFTVGRAAVKAVREMMGQGMRFAYAEPDRSEPTALSFLTGLGFETDPRTTYLYRLRAGE